MSPHIPAPGLLRRDREGGEAGRGNVLPSEVSALPCPSQGWHQQDPRPGRKSEFTPLFTWISL